MLHKKTFLLILVLCVGEVVLQDKVCMSRATCSKNIEKATIKAIRRYTFLNNRDVALRERRYSELISAVDKFNKIVEARPEKCRNHQITAPPEEYLEDIWQECAKPFGKRPEWSKTIERKVDEFPKGWIWNNTAEQRTEYCRYYTKYVNHSCDVAWYDTDVLRACKPKEIVGRMYKKQWEECLKE